ncbi:MAG TPA: phosphatidate cytidylyltransferase [Burkholderiales bacterium]|nr:phosphatidate cytidylyltransferase [Burkholderiales bacterium]
MLKQRILTVAVLLPAVLAGLFFLPNLYWALAMMLGLAVAAFEWGRLAGLGAKQARVYAAALALLAAAILAAESLTGGARAFVYTPFGKFLYVLCAAFWLAIAPAWLYSRWEVRSTPLLLCVGAVVLLPFWHAAAWLQLDPGRLLLALGVIWVADTAAYFFGRALGRHKLAPKISPGKTWEGAIGALLAVMAGWLMVAHLVPSYSASMLSGLILVAVLTIIGIQGDLFESWLKRMAGQKDSGQLLPGHGGLLDRIDALTSTLPLAALYFAYPALRI